MKKEKDDIEHNYIVLWEHQKKRVCEFYGCSDSSDEQYPECKGVYPKECSLNTTANLISYLNTGKR